MKRYKLNSFVRVRSKGKMIKTAPSDTLRPPWARQQSSHTLGARSSRQVDLWTTRASNSIRLRGTSWRSSQRLGLRFAGPPKWPRMPRARRSAAKHQRRRSQVPRELGQRFPSLTGRKIIRHAARSSRWQRGIQEHMALDPQISAARPRTSAGIQGSLKIGILDLGVLRWADPNRGQNGGQTYSA